LQGYTLLPTQTTIPIPLRCYRRCLQNANLKILVGIIVRTTRSITAARYKIDFSKAEMTVSAFLMSFLVAEVIISALEKTASAVPAQSDQSLSDRQLQWLPALIKEIQVSRRRLAGCCTSLERSLLLRRCLVSWRV